MKLLKDNQLRCDEWQNLEPYLDPESGVEDYRSAIVTALAVGPVDIRAGQQVHITCSHQFDIESYARGAYTISGHQSEHWYLYAMCSLAVHVGPDPTVDGLNVVPARGTNWDWNQHHMPQSAIDWWEAPYDMPGAYFYDRIWFEASKNFVVPGQARCRIRGGGYPSLSAAIFTSTR